jgi:hypothetical protein
MFTLKLEVRIPKSETNSNDQNPKTYRPVIARVFSPFGKGGFYKRLNPYQSLFRCCLNNKRVTLTEMGWGLLALDGRGLKLAPYLIRG